jgi:hypothetical protein
MNNPQLSRKEENNSQQTKSLNTDEESGKHINSLKIENKTADTQLSRKEEIPTPVIVTINQRKNKIKVKIVYDYDMKLWRINII